MSLLFHTINQFGVYYKHYLEGKLKDWTVFSFETLPLEQGKKVSEPTAFRCNVINANCASRANWLKKSKKKKLHCSFVNCFSLRRAVKMLAKQSFPEQEHWAWYTLQFVFVFCNFHWHIGNCIFCLDACPLIQLTPTFK